MPGILDYLPFLDGWNYKSYEYSVLVGQPPIAIKPGAEQILLEEKHTRGFLLIVNLQVTTPFAEMHISARTPGAAEEFDFGISAAVLLAAGLFDPTHLQFWCSNPQMVINTGTIVEAAGATPQPLSQVPGGIAIWPRYPLSLRAPASNVGNVYIGNTAAAAAPAVGDPLQPGDSKTIKDQGLLSHIWTSGSVAGDKLIYSHEVPDTINGDSAFAMNLTPPYPLPYADGFQLKCENPAVLPISQIPGVAAQTQNGVTAKVYYFNAVFIKISNEQAFDASLKRLLGVLQ